MCLRWLGLFVISVFCLLFLMAGAGISSNSTTLKAGCVGESAGEVNDANGPTVLLSYDGRSARRNPTSCFMYFVPLVSPILVDLEINADNQQEVRGISYEKEVTAKAFSVRSEFEMLGDGFYKNTFNAEEIIAICLKDTKPGEPLTNALDYIKFEGKGLGRIEVRGTITGSTRTVTEVDVHFNARGQKSPVTIGLYSIRPKDGQYRYENRYNELIARVATLTFRKSEGTPRMGVKIVSVNRAEKPNGLIGRIKGTIANFFIDPPEVSRVGNETMLEFGLALLEEKTEFAFPKAQNIRSTKAALREE